MSMRNKNQDRRKDKRELKHSGSIYLAPVVEFYEAKPPKAEPLRTLNQSQFDYINSLKNNIITFGYGTNVAGTGRTYCAAAYAAQLLEEKKIDRIIVCRPGVECGKSYGALPGELAEKYYPFIRPVQEILEKRLGKSTVEYHIKRKNIEFTPLEFLRGTTFDDSFIMLDEAQNTDCRQMKMLLERVGEGSLICVNGDLGQKDIREKSGLQDAIERLKTVANVGIVEFDFTDCVRSGMALEILRAYQ